METVASRRLVAFLKHPSLAISFSVILLATSFMFTSAAQPDGKFDRYYSFLLYFNIFGASLLAILISVNIWRLFKQYRAGILGSKLSVRLVFAFALLSLLPLSVVYYFAIQFLSRSIDSWFDVRIEKALDDAMLLGQNSLAAINRDLIRQVKNQSILISDTNSDIELIRLLDEFRENGEYSEMSVFARNGSIVASSQDLSGALIPDTPDKRILERVTSGLEYSQIEPLSQGALQLRIVLPLRAQSVVFSSRYLQVLYPLPLRFSKLGASIQTASEEYEKLQYLRTPLKFNFVVTLSLIALMTGLISFWIALYLSRRMMQPMRQLAEGTRAVAQGDYETRLKETGSDELGVLVRSFNDMTREIQQAQTQAASSQKQVEQQRTYLEALLAHLSSGVMSFDTNGLLITCNESAENILNTSLQSFIGQASTAITLANPWVEPLFLDIEDEILKKAIEWRHEINLNSERGRQTLLTRGAFIPGERSDPGGFVILFDDLTELVRAQRNAAWGEVARRLAHEIKNPLTPIQLSAERIRHKYLPGLTGKQRDTLDRATRTIAQQVESMKTMVNAFSEYAQPVKINLLETDINRLIQDVAELHETNDELLVQTNLDETLPPIQVDPSQLRQVLNNLIINSRDALSAQENRPQIVISSRLEQSTSKAWVEISVQDNGPGVPEDLLERIFEPYVTTKEKGTGLGLAIVRRIIEEHNGRINVGNSTEGAWVKIRLPYTESSAKNPQTTHSQKQQQE
jgi:nitrogen fixation/metabolism regulation signal transduction histidine kinase